MNTFPALILLALISTIIILLSSDKNTSLLRKSNSVLDAESSSDVEDPRVGLLAKVQDMYPDPSLRVKASGPRELFLSSLSGQKDSSVTITEDMIGNFFFDLVHDQAIYDAAVALSGAIDGGELEFASKSDSEDLDPLESKLAEVCMARIDPSRLGLMGFDAEHEKRRLAGYMEERVMPSWFADHRQELCDLLSVSDCDKQESSPRG